MVIIGSQLGYLAVTLEVIATILAYKKKKKKKKTKAVEEQKR
jgi:hypothetical protein